jgi:HK97 family phage prohead protease
MKRNHEWYEGRSLFDVASDPDTLTLTGYASTFEPYEMYGGPAQRGWIEQLDRTAFDATLRESPDLHLLINHQGMPLARTKSGTLQLSVDDHGLKVVARPDRSDPDVQRLEPKMRRGDMDQMSFAFRVKAQEWKAAPGFTDPESLRIIRAVDLNKGDVSVVNFGANPTTTASVRSAESRDGRTRLILARAKVNLSKGN